MAAGPGEPDVISSDAPLSPAPTLPTRRERLAGVGARSAALTTAVSLVLVGGVVTAAVRGTGGNTASAATVVPANAFGFAEADLSLHGESAALSAFLGHFPTVRAKLGNDGPLRERLLRAMLKSSSDPHVDYDKDIKPWLGDHVAVAGWMDGTKPQVEFALQSTDDSAARRSLHKLSPRSGIGFSHGFAIVAPSQQAVDHAITAASKASLDGTGFKSDVAALGGSQIVTGWLDGAQAKDAVTSLFRGMPLDTGSLGAVPLGGGLAGNALASASGRLVVGLRATDTYAELVVQQVTGTVSHAGQQPTSLLTHLPDRTLAAIELTQPEKLVSGLLSAAGLFLNGFRSAGIAATGSMPRGYSSYSPLGSGSATIPLTPAQPSRAPSTNPVDIVKGFTGLTLPGDVGTLLGPAAVVSYGGLQPGGVPNIALRGQPANVDAARALADHARDVVHAHSPLDLTVTTAGGDLIAATNAGYASAVAAGGSLGSQSRFATAMGELPSTVSFAAYVDLASIVPLFSHGQQDLNHLDAAGLWAGTTEKGSRFQLRLVVH